MSFVVFVGDWICGRGKISVVVGKFQESWEKIGSHWRKVSRSGRKSVEVGKISRLRKILAGIGIESLFSLLICLFWFQVVSQIVSQIVRLVVNTHTHTHTHTHTRVRFPFRVEIIWVCPFTCSSCPPSESVRDGSRGLWPCCPGVWCVCGLCSGCLVTHWTTPYTE